MKQIETVSEQMSSDEIREEVKSVIEKAQKIIESDPISVCKKLFPEIDKQLSGDTFDLSERAQKTKEFIQNKSTGEILDRAQQRYNDSIEQGDLNQVYEIAKKFLGSRQVENAAKKIFTEKLQVMKTSKSKKERIAAAKNILLSSFMPEIQRSSTTVEKALEIMFLLRDKRGRRSEIGFYEKNLPPGALQWLKSPIKNKKIALAAHFLARQKIQELIHRHQHEQALEIAQTYENKGILDLDNKDIDLLEDLTK